MKGERQVAGLWCHEVLARLYDYIDDDLDPQTRHSVESHLSGCTVCESFGGRAAALVKAVKSHLGPPEPISDELHRRLQQLPEDPQAS